MNGLPRHAIVTGAASGIGFATAKRLTADGWRVSLVDLDEVGLARAEKEVGGPPESTASFPFDLMQPSGFPRLLGEIITARGDIGLLVNNAGIGVAATAIDTTDDDWDRTIAVNLTAMFHTCRAVLPGMITTGEGRIVNVASVAGVVGIRNRAAYCASKAGVIGLTRALAADHAHQGIRVNAICPGTVATEWIGKILANAEDPEATRKAMEQRQLDGRMGSAEEVAAGIAFLAADEARFMNGAALVMDGGMTAV